MCIEFCARATEMINARGKSVVETGNRGASSVCVSVHSFCARYRFTGETEELEVVSLPRRLRIRSRFLYDFFSRTNRTRERAPSHDCTPNSSPDDD